MNVLVLTQEIDPRRGGVAVFVRNVCSEMAKAGLQIRVLAPASEAARERHPELKRVVEGYRSSPRLSAVSPVAKTLALSLTAKVQVLLLGHFMSTHGFGAVILRKLFGIPYAILVHGFDLEYLLSNGVDRVVSRMILRNASLVFANSEYTKDEIGRRGYYRDRIVVASPGVDVEVFRPGRDTSAVVERYRLAGKRVCLTVGRLVQRKGHEMVIRAIPMVLSRIPNFVYLVAGSGPEERYLRKLVIDLGVADHVVFLGYVEDAELPALYCASDVFVMPNRQGPAAGDREGFGIVFAEASACGRPVIGGSSGGTTEVIRHGETGLLVDPTDVGDIAEAITKVLCEPEYARALGANGRRRVTARFSWKKSTGTIVESLESLLGGEKEWSPAR